MNKRRSFIISIAMLLAGMTIGFLLLATVYDGPGWVKLAVFLAYLLISFLTVRFSKGYADWLKESDKTTKNAG